MGDAEGSLAAAVVVTALLVGWLAWACVGAPLRQCTRVPRGRHRR